MLTEKQRERFFAKVAKRDNGCWEWFGCRNKNGYGRLAIYGKLWYAHRLSYVQHRGPIKTSLFVCHKCDNPCCVNPDHLFLGTRQDNMDDMVRKGRGSNQQGQNNGAAKLTEEEILDIVKLLPTMNNKEIAQRFEGRLTHSMVSRIRLGKSWAHVTGIEEGNISKYASIKKPRK